MVIYEEVNKSPSSNTSTTTTTKRAVIPDYEEFNALPVVPGKGYQEGSTTKHRVVIPGLEWTKDNKLALSAKFRTKPVVPGVKYSEEDVALVNPVHRLSQAKFVVPGKSYVEEKKEAAKADYVKIGVPWSG